MNSPTMRSEKSGQRTGSTASPTTQAAAEKLQECSTHYVTEPASLPRDLLLFLNNALARSVIDIGATRVFSCRHVVGCDDFQRRS
mgnify:CR=1 FL=1